MNDKNGIYMPNLNYIPGNAQARFEAGHFQWAVVRTDSHPVIARWCRDHGAQVIVQLPDHFNRYPPRDPYAYASECLAAAVPYAPFSHIICLDNEPNLGQASGGRWFAEEFTRWLRAVHSCFRWLDKAGHWELVFPALCHPWDQMGRYWLRTNLENLKECEWLGLHVYWAGHDDYQAGRPTDTLRPYLDLVPNAHLLITEYGDGDFNTPDEREALDYQHFVLSLPVQVRGACKFLLAGSEEWADYFLTDFQAHQLGLL